MKRKLIFIFVIAIAVLLSLIVVDIFLIPRTAGRSNDDAVPKLTDKVISNAGDDSSFAADGADILSNTDDDSDSTGMDNSYPASSPSPVSGSYSVAIGDIKFYAYTKADGQEGFMISMRINNTGDELVEDSVLSISIDDLKVKAAKKIRPFSDELLIDNIFLPIPDGALAGEYPVAISFEHMGRQIGSAEYTVEIESETIYSGGGSRRSFGSSSDDDDKTTPTPTVTPTPTQIPDVDIDLEIVDVNGEQPGIDMPMFTGDNKMEINARIVPHQDSDVVMLYVTIPGTDIEFEKTYYNLDFGTSVSIPISLKIPDEEGKYNVDVEVSFGDFSADESFSIEVTAVKYQGQITEAEFRNEEGEPSEEFTDGDTMYPVISVFNTGIFDWEDSTVTFFIAQLGFSSEEFYFGGWSAGFFGPVEDKDLIVPIDCECSGSYTIKTILKVDGEIIDTKEHDVWINGSVV